MLVSYMHLEKSSIYWDPIFSHVYNGDSKTYISDSLRSSKEIVTDLFCHSALQGPSYSVLEKIPRQIICSYQMAQNSG